MYAEHIEYTVVYTAAMERERIRSQQIHQAPALPPSKAHAGPGKAVTVRIHSLRQTVLRLLRSKPGVFLTAGEIAREIGEEPRRVHYTIGDLVGEGYVKRLKVRSRSGQKYAARM